MSDSVVRARLLLGVLAIVVAACIAPGASGPSGGGASFPAASFDPTLPITAARAFLNLESATFQMTYDRFITGVGVERQWEASGVVDPAADRGSMQWLVTALVPPVPPAISQPPIGLTVVWNATDWWAASFPAAAYEREWKHRSRAGARESAILGRIQEEALALIRFAAEADPTSVERPMQARIDGAAGDRWLIKVPLDRASAAYVPPDTYLALRETFGIESFPLEVWMVDGAIRRVGYVVERKKGPDRVPDRLETWYHWSGLGDRIYLVIPPAGRYVELKP